MLKTATMEDADRILEMSMSFMGDTQFKNISDEESIKSVIKALIEAPDDQAIIFVHEHGFIAGLVSRFIFGQRKVATEVAWFVEPEFRAHGIGVELLDGFERWAVENGCELVTMVSLDESVDGFYEEMGYALREKAYMKVLK